MSESTRTGRGLHLAQAPLAEDPLKMPIGLYRFNDGPGPAWIEEDRVHDLRPTAPTLDKLLLQSRLARPNTAHVPLDQARLLPPVAPGAAVYAIGLNYRDHALETGRALPKQPTVFAKLPLSVAPPFGATPHPGFSDSFDYEGELGVVIGRPTRLASREGAMAHVCGYVVLNDLTVRALARPDTLLLGKNGPGFAPIGPWIVAAGDVADPHTLRIRTWVNGELRQDGSTADMHHRIPDLIALLSRSVPLRTGDIISTGSPRGSGIGFDPPRFLKTGDRVRIEIDEVGAIETLITPPLPDALGG